MVQAGQKLVVLEVDSAKVCQTGLREEPEIHWKQDVPDTLEPCRELKHLLQRTARDCPDVHFVHLDVSAYPSPPCHLCPCLIRLFQTVFLLLDLPFSGSPLPACPSPCQQGTLLVTAG